MDISVFWSFIDLKKYSNDLRYWISYFHEIYAIFFHLEPVPCFCHSITMKKRIETFHGYRICKFTFFEIVFKMKKYSSCERLRRIWLQNTNVSLLLMFLSLVKETFVQFHVSIDSKTYLTTHITTTSVVRKCLLSCYKNRVLPFALSYIKHSAVISVDVSFYRHCLYWSCVLL